MLYFGQPPCFCLHKLLEFISLELFSFHCIFYISLQNWYIPQDPGIPWTQTKFAEPFQVLPDDFLAFQYLSNWNRSLLIFSYCLGLYVRHKSQSVNHICHNFLVARLCKSSMATEGCCATFLPLFSLHPFFFSKKYTKHVQEGAKTPPASSTLTACSPPLSYNSLHHKELPL